MFQFQPFTQAERDADPRLARMVKDMQRLLRDMQVIVDRAKPSKARDAVEMILDCHRQTQRNREASHYAALQAENVRRGWKPSTFTEILGEPQHDTRIEERDEG